MAGRPHHQIVEDKTASPECNPILHVLALFPRTGARGRAGDCWGGGEAVAGVCLVPTGNKWRDGTTMSRELNVKS